MWRSIEPSIEDAEARADLQELARRYNKKLIAERGMETEAQGLEIIRDMLANPSESRLTVKDITNTFIERHGMDYERKITTKWVGNIVRKRLGLHARALPVVERVAEKP